MNLVQGGARKPADLSPHIPASTAFSSPAASTAGIALRRLWPDHPDKILALEMGGNNPLIVTNVSDIQAAAYHTIQSAFITAGQRCSLRPPIDRANGCSRRSIHCRCC